MELESKLREPDQEPVTTGGPYPWGHFTQMKGQEPRVIVKAYGSTIVDAAGKEYIDGLAGLFLVNVGHGRKEIHEAIARQLEELEYYSLFMGFSNPPAIKLAQKLAEITPPGLNHSFFVNGGSEAVDTAFKIARQFHLREGKRRYKVISRRRAYHGVTMGALSANGVTPIRTPFEPLVPGFSHVSPPYCYRCEFGLSYPACDLQCAKAVEQEIVAQGPDTIAAFIAEPVIGSAGCIPPPPEYFPLVRQICDRHGVLLILDEVICGFGRTGKLFASEHWNVVPDLMTVAKGLGSGYVPIGATIAKNEVYEQFLGDDSATFSHGITFGGHPVACAAALANVEIILREKLAERAAEMGRYLMDGLKQLEKHPIVGEIRGLGMLIGIELVADRQTKRQFPPSARVGQQISAVAWEMGLMVRNNWDIMQLSPPLVLTKEEADRVVDILDRSFAQVQAKLGLS